jgi:hypothetical protein
MLSVARDGFVIRKNVVLDGKTLFKMDLRSAFLC